MLRPCPCVPSALRPFLRTAAGRVRRASTRADLYTCAADRLKGMPGALIDEYQRHLRFYGVDNMSSTGGVLSAAHSPRDIEEATAAFRKTVVALRDRGLVLAM